MTSTRRSMFLCLLMLWVTTAWSQVESYNYGDAKTTSDFSFFTPPADASLYKLSDAGKNSGNVNNVIFMIGDGMGDAQIALTREQGKAGKLYMEKLPVRGQIATVSLSGTTDSAAAGTALACGIKTRNKAIGVNPSGVAYENILGASKHIGKKTALVATSTISHATPASFASHVNSREEESDIAAQMFENRVNVMLGGGRQYWVPSSEKGGKSKGARNLINEASEAGYTVVKDLAELSKVEGAYVLGLFQMGALNTSGEEPSLPQMTREALRILGSNKLSGNKGFFMMVEGSQIDWACHANNAEYCVKQTLLFDLAVKEAMEFALADGHTLVIVTADHETGGLALEESSAGKPVAKWQSKGHSSTPVPLFAFGPGADKFSTVKDNTEVPQTIAKLLDISDFPRIKP